MDYLHDFWDFVHQVFVGWVGLASGVVGLAVTIWEKRRSDKKGAGLATERYFLILMLAFFPAYFFAWHGMEDNLRARQAEIASLRKPADAGGAPTQSEGVPAARPPQASPSPGNQRAPILDAPSVEALRRATGVRALRPLENDLRLSRLPDGVFGYTVPWMINTDPSGVVGGTGVDKISLEQRSLGTLVMEIQKLKSDLAYEVGCVSDSDVTRLQDPSRQTDLQITLFFKPYHEFTHVVAIPLSRVQKSDNREVEDEYVDDQTIR